MNCVSASAVFFLVGVRRLCVPGPSTLLLLALAKMSWWPCTLMLMLCVRSCLMVCALFLLSFLWTAAMHRKSRCMEISRRAARSEAFSADRACVCVCICMYEYKYVYTVTGSRAVWIFRAGPHGETRCRLTEPVCVYVYVCMKTNTYIQSQEVPLYGDFAQGRTEGRVFG